jgi:hypothetical protein
LQSAIFGRRLQSFATSIAEAAHGFFLPQRRPLPAGPWRAIGQTRRWEKQAGTIEHFKEVGVDL